MSSLVRWYLARASASSSGVFFRNRKYDRTFFREVDVRVERVALKHHADAPGAGRHVGTSTSS